MLESEMSSVGNEPWLGHCVVFLDKLTSHGATLLLIHINGYTQITRLTGVSSNFQQEEQQVFIGRKTFLN